MNKYAETLSIDEFALDKEWKEQPARFMFYVQEQVEAEAVARRLKERLDFTKSKLYIKIRMSREANKEKVTEAILDAFVKEQPEYEEVNMEYLEALEQSQILKGAVEAFNQRKYALENLVKLHIAGYYSTPSDKDMGKKIAQGNQEEIESNLNRRRK